MNCNRKLTDTVHITMLMTLLSFGLFMTASAHAQEGDWYTIEVIIFEQAGSRWRNAENWIEPPIAAEMDKARYLGSSHSGHPPQNFARLPASQHHLAGVAAKLGRTGYRVLQHRAWRQQLTNRNNAIGVRIQAGPQYFRSGAIQSNGQPLYSSTNAPAGAYGDALARVHRLGGTVTVAVGRYLHVWTDIVYQLARPAGGEQLFQLSSTTLREHRRMRSGEIHYLDHPVIGMLIRVTPYRAAATNTGSAAEDDPADADIPAPDAIKPDTAN